MTMTKEEIMKIADLENLSLAQLKEAQKVMEDAHEKHLQTLQEALEDLDDDDKMALFREYAEDGHYEERFYPMHMLDEVVGQITSASDFIRDLGKFSLNDDGFWYSPSTGDLTSGNVGDFLDNFFFASDIASWLEGEEFDTAVSFDWLDELNEIIEMVDSIDFEIECRDDEEE